MVAGADVPKHRLVKASGKAGFSEAGSLEVIWGGERVESLLTLSFSCQGPQKGRNAGSELLGTSRLPLEEVKLVSDTGVTIERGP